MKKLGIIVLVIAITISLMPWAAPSASAGEPIGDITASLPGFDKTLPPDATRDYALTIANNGDTTLTYSISDRETTNGTSTARMENQPVKPACEILEVPAEGRALKSENIGEAQAGWQNIITENFEGDFPASWNIMSGDTEAYWGKEDHERHGGSYSAFCAKGGAAGVDAPDNYPNNMSTWMIHGPFTLADASDAELTFWYWLDTQMDHDYLKCMASINGTTYSGRQYSGNSQGWVSRSFALTDVYNLGNLCGEPEVWIAFGFTSDGSITGKGAFIDDVVLRKYEGAEWDPLEYDTNEDGIIQKTEAIGAIQDYFGGKITKAQAIAVIMLYFQGPPPDDYILQESQTIGPEGGELATDDFSLTVPQGAFYSAAELKLYASSTDSPFGDNGVSRTFKLEGLPPYYSEPLQLSIKYQGTLSHGSFIAIGKEALIPILDETETVYDLFPATESSGYLLCQLPPVLQGFGATREGDYYEASLKLGPEPAKPMVAITDYETYTSAAGHFIIKHPADVTDLVDDVAGYLEDAYDTFKQMGINYQSRTYPDQEIDAVDVIVKKFELPTDLFSYVDDNPAEQRHEFKVEISKDMMTQAKFPELRIAAGRGFFYLVAELHWTQPYAFWYEDHWFFDACAAWSEEKFASQPNHIPGCLYTNEIAPFYGMHAGAEHPDNPMHGYGMSAMIKYLVGLYGENVLPAMYQQVRYDMHPVEAVYLSIADPVSVWWPDFFKEYVSGKIYGVTAATFTNEKHISDVFNTETDASETFSGSYPDVSAKIYRVNLNDPTIEDNAHIKFEVNSTDVILDDLMVLVFKLKGESLEYLDQGTDITVSNVKELTDEGSHLIAVVVNSSCLPDYKQSSTIDLKIELIKGGLDYSYCLITLWFNGDLEKAVGGPYTMKAAYWPANAWDRAPGSFSGNTFTSSWEWGESDYDYSWQRRGEMTVTVDPANHDVIYFEATETHTGQYSDGSSTESTWSIRSTTEARIPRQPESDESYLKCKIFGEGACDHIDSIEHEASDTYGWWERIVGWRCDSESLILIEFWTEESV